MGAVGPVTNRISNEAQIEVHYRTYREFVQFAQEYTRAHEGEVFDIRMLAMFCVAMRREVYERIGPLDERYEVGLFEDDDYALRLRAAGYRVSCVQDVFVHHFGQASFGNLVPSGEYSRLFEANRRRFQEKWGVQWESHHRRLSQGYHDLTSSIRAVVRDNLPQHATVLVVSRGDEALLELDGRQAWHFPQLDDGTYAGYYPTNSAVAIAHLEKLRAKGARFLIFPSTAFWWLEHYSDFRRHLERHHLLVGGDETCLIFALDASS